MKVLIADDSEMILKRIKILIDEKPDLELVGEADNSIKAIKLIEQYEPDIVTIDLKMPGGGGLEVLKFAKEKFPNIITIVLTNYVDDSFRMKAQALGTDYFLDKTNMFTLNEIFEEKLNLIK